MNTYSENPTARYLASLSTRGREIYWPFGNWGAANAWLVLLGPSPGKDDGGTKGTHRLGIGERCPIIFDSQPGRNPGWRRIWEAPFGKHLHNESENIAEYLTALVNLDSTNEANELALDRAALVSGCARVEQRIAQCHAKLVVALTGATFSIFKNYLGERFVPEEGPGFFEPHRGNTGGTFQLDGVGHRSWLIRGPQHPSHPLPAICWPPYKTKIDRILDECETIAR